MMNQEVAYYIAQGISVATAVIAILSVQLKNMKGILVTQLIGNFLASSTYFLLGGFTGAGVSIIAVVQTVIMYLYNVKDKKPHVAVTVAFISAYVLNAALTYSSAFDILPAVAAVCYALSVVQTKPMAFRFFNIWNPLCWIFYDVYKGAHVNFLTHLGIFISVVIACVRLDGFFGLLNKKQKQHIKEKENE
jgi:hypothetical protein